MNQINKAKNQPNSNKVPQKGEKISTIGLIMPISGTKDSDLYTAMHWENVKSIIEDAANQGKIPIVSEKAGSSLIQARIVKNIYKSDLIIADLSSGNANVMFEVGIRMTFGKPILLIQDDQTENYFDISPVQHFVYDADLNYPSVHKFQSELKKEIVNVIDNGGGKQYKSYFFDTKIKEAKSETVKLESLELLSNKIDELSLNVNHLVNKSQSIDEYSAHIHDNFATPNFSSPKMDAIAQMGRIAMVTDRVYNYLRTNYDMNALGNKGVSLKLVLNISNDMGISLNAAEAQRVCANLNDRIRRN